MSIGQKQDVRLSAKAQKGIQEISNIKVKREIQRL